VGEEKKDWDTDWREDRRSRSGAEWAQCVARARGGITVEAEAASWAFICTASDDDDEEVTVKLALMRIA
jgi:hypothetical protein